MAAFLRILFCALFVTLCRAKTFQPDFLEPCDFKDGKCVADLWNKAVKALVSGDQDLGLPSLDPMKINDESVEIPGIVKLNFNGDLKGIRNCVFDDLKNSIKKGHYKQTLSIRCNVTLKGQYDARANSSVIFGIGNGDLLKADGDGRVDVSNLRLKFLMDFKVVKDPEDGEVKFVLEDGPIGYKYKVGGPVKFYGNHIVVAGQDISNLVVTFMNANWKLMMDNFGASFILKALSVVEQYQREFFKVVSAKSYFTNDMTEYAL